VKTNSNCQSEVEPFWDLELGYYSLKDGTLPLSEDDVESIVGFVKEKCKFLLISPKMLIRTIGYAYARFLSNPQDICTAIKRALAEEVTAKIISDRKIERLCPDEWKKKTKPKKNDNMSFSLLCGGSITNESRTAAETNELTSQGADGPQRDPTKDNEELIILGPCGSKKCSCSEQVEGSREGKQGILAFSQSISVEKLRRQIENIHERVHGMGNIWICWKLNSVRGEITELRFSTSDPFG
jgi:hypothetical protein